jgi:hypothetical protein
MIPNKWYSSRALGFVAAIAGIAASSQPAIALPSLDVLGLRPVHVSPAPLAVPLGGGTLLFSGRIDAGLQTKIRNSNSDSDFYGNGQLSLNYEQKLTNGATIGATITGEGT